MKKQLMRVVNTTLLSKFFKTTAVVFLLSGGYAVAQSRTVSAPIEYAGTGIGKTVINHLSSDNQSMLFEVKVENAGGENFTIVVKDDEGNTLYRNAFTEKNFTKKFRLPKAEATKITFQIRSSSGNMAESFEINSNTRMVEEVVVKKVI